MGATDFTGVRASSCVGCKRKGYYEGVDAERNELSKQTKRLFRIRKLQNDGVMAERAEEARALGRKIVLEQEIPWGPHNHWTGHADYADHTDKVIIEATGSADLSPDRRKILQAAFYAKRMSEITGELWGAWVMVFDPSTGEERFVPVDWQALAFELDMIVADVVDAIQAGVAPEGVCDTPSDGPAMFCQFRDTCFRGFEYPPMGELPKRLEGPLLQLVSLKERTDTKLLDKDKGEPRTALVNGLAPKTRYRAMLGAREVEVSVSHVEPGVGTVSYKEILDAGFDLPPELKQFIKPGKPSTRVNTKVIGGAE